MPPFIEILALCLAMLVWFDVAWSIAQRELPNGRAVPLIMVCLSSIAAIVIYNTLNHFYQLLQAVGG